MNYTIKRYFNGKEEEHTPLTDHQIKNKDVLDIIDHAVERNNNQFKNHGIGGGISFAPAAKANAHETREF